MTALPPFPTGSIPEALRPLLGEVVIVDTDTHYVFLGKLEHADREFLCLSQVDIHEIRPSGLNKERYAHEARKIGVRANRDLTYIPMARVVALSRLSDVKDFQ